MRRLLDPAQLRGNHVSCVWTSARRMTVGWCVAGVRLNASAAAHNRIGASMLNRIGSALSHTAHGTGLAGTLYHMAAVRPCLSAHSAAAAVHLLRCLPRVGAAGLRRKGPRRSLAHDQLRAPSAAELFIERTSRPTDRRTRRAAADRHGGSDAARRTRTRRWALQALASWRSVRSSPLHRASLVSRGRRSLVGSTRCRRTRAPATQ